MLNLLKRFIPVKTPVAEKPTYNGWSNCETWLVALWLGKTDPATDEHSRAIANTQSELYYRASDLKEFVYHLCMGDDQEINGQSASLAVDLLNDAIETADYREIIQNLQEENA